MRNRTEKLPFAMHQHFNTIETVYQLASTVAMQFDWGKDNFDQEYG